MDNTEKIVGKRGFIIIPGGGATEEEAKILENIPYVPEGTEFPVLRIWENHDAFQSTMNLVKQINELFLAQFGKLPDVLFEQNATIPISGSTYSTPMIKFRLDVPQTDGVYAWRSKEEFESEQEAYDRGG